MAAPACRDLLADAGTVLVAVFDAECFWACAFDLGVNSSTTAVKTCALFGRLAGFDGLNDQGGLSLYPKSVGIVWPG